MTFNAKLSCVLNLSGASYSSPVALRIEPESQESYVNTFNFLSDLTGSGTVERIAYYIGSPGSGALGTGTDYWWTSNASGGNAWSVWRFPSSSLRTYDYYLLIQHAGGGNSTAQLGNISQSYGFVDVVQSYVNTYRGMFAYQLAASYDPTTGLSSNPWNGTVLNNGNDTKGTPTWKTGSVGHELLVLPAGNTTRPNKDQLAAIYFRGNVGTANTRNLSIFSWNGTDNDGIAFVYFDLSTGNPPTIPTTDYYSFVTYIGTYNVRPELTSSIKCPLVGVGGDCSNQFHTAVFRGDTAQISYSGSSGIAGSGSNVYRTYALQRTGIWSLGNNTAYFGSLKNSIITPGVGTYEVEPIWLLPTGALGYYCGMAGYMSKYFGHMNASFPYTAQSDNAIYSSPDSSQQGSLFFPWPDRNVAWPYSNTVSGTMITV